MRWGLLVLVLGIAATGCKKELTPKQAQEAELERLRQAAAEEADREDSAPPGSYVVTAGKLDAFVRYQRRMIEVQAALVRDTQRLMSRTDGGLATAQASMDVLRSKADAEEAARRELGLTAHDVRMLSGMVMEVASRRSLARSLRLDDALAELAEAQQRLGTERQEELAEQIEAVRKQHEALSGLRDARARWGDANVELLLTREADLTRNYQDMLEQFEGAARKPAQK